MLKRYKVIFILCLILCIYFIQAGESAGAADKSYSIISKVITFRVLVQEKQDSANTVYVGNEYDENTPGWGKTRFNNIPEAFAAVPEGGTMNIEAGTYELKQRLSISKDIDIKGAGMKDTIIELHTGSAGAIDAGSGAVFNMSGLTIDGLGQNIPYAIFVNGANANVCDVRIKNIDVNNGGRGIKVDSTPSMKGGITVDSCDFESISKYGVAVYGTNLNPNGTSAKILNSSFTGGCNNNRTPANDQSAIYVYGQVDAEIFNNNIKDYKSTDSSGIYIGSGDASIRDNTIEGCTAGIYVNIGCTIDGTVVTKDNAEEIGERLKTENNNTNVTVPVT